MYRIHSPVIPSLAPREFSVAALIPAHEEARTIAAVVRGAARHVDKVVVVDDGSSDDTALLAAAAGAEVIHHPQCLGKGCALRTGLERLVDEGFDHVILLDGDFQHLPEETLGFVDRIEAEHPPLIIGERTDRRCMPFLRKITNAVMSWLISAVCRQRITDSQCGFRSMRADVIHLVLAKCDATGFDFESEMLIEASRAGYRIASEPVSTVYGGEKSSIHPVRDTLRFLALMARKIWAYFPWAYAVFFLLLFATRGFLIYTNKFNTDEPQHLHVVWGWAHGLVQYRDLFDNHAPLFHLFFAPFFWLAERFNGQHASILFTMRWLMAPVFAVGLWLVYRIARQCMDRPAALFAAAVTAVVPFYYFPFTLQFRTDNLWTVTWLASLFFLLRPPKLRNVLLGGLLLGITLSISMKTTLMLLAVGFAGLAQFILHKVCHLPSDPRYRKNLPWLAATFFLVPAALVLWFWHEGVMSAMYYCVIQHNCPPGMHTNLWKKLPFLLYAPLIFFVGWFLSRLRPASLPNLRYVFLFHVAAFYLGFLWCFWPALTGQDYLPWIPLVCTLAALPLRSLLSRLLKNESRLRGLEMASLILLLAGCLTINPIWQDRTTEYLADTDKVLRLTDPSDYVQDAKGVTIFRRRPFYYVLETIALGRIHRGQLPDNMPEVLTATSTPVVRTDRSTPRGLPFVHDNYLRYGGKIYVAGKNLDDSAFEIAVALPYQIMAGRGPAMGILDGSPYKGGPVYLSKGPHTFQSQGGTSGRQYAVWSKAIERGYFPDEIGGKS